MENLNFSLSKMDTDFYQKRSTKLEQILRHCELVKYSITHLYLGDASRWFRDTEDALYFEAKFSELGVELVYTAPRKEIY